MQTAIYTLTSDLHDKTSVDALTHNFLDSLGIDYQLHIADYSDYGQHDLDLIYVRTGGTEGIFKQLLPDLQRKSHRPFYLLTSGMSNSLAASMEILSFLRQRGIGGEIIHGSTAYVSRRVKLLATVGAALRRLRDTRLGIVGAPSDWLISSGVERTAVKERLGIELKDIPMEALLGAISGGLQEGVASQWKDQSEECADLSSAAAAAQECVRQAMPGAMQIYEGLKTVIARYDLQGLTLRCFDLLTALHNTGCLALARLNAEGFVASCEGDMPAMLSMMIVRALTGVSGFQANPAAIDPETGEIVLAHCTIPFDMVDRYELHTHFESGIGVAIRGYMNPGPVTIFKVSGYLTRCFIAEGELVRSGAKPDLCRTQQVIRLADKSQARYFLTDPIGNHHIVVPGHHREVLQQIMSAVPAWH